MCQKFQTQINPYVDSKLIHFGFSVGLHNSDLIFTHEKKSSVEASNIYVEIPSSSLGFNVSLLADLRLHRYINLRFQPSLYFSSREIVFRDYATFETHKQELKSTYLSFPLLLKFSSERLKNVRPYVIAGGSCNIDLYRKKGEALLLKPFWAGLELGIGCTIYFQYFRFTPEIKFCLGLTDLLEKDRPDLTNPEWGKYTDALSKVTARMFVITLTFE